MPYEFREGFFALITHTILLSVAFRVISIASNGPI